LQNKTPSHTTKTQHTSISGIPSIYNKQHKIKITDNGWTKSPYHTHHYTIFFTSNRQSNTSKTEKHQQKQQIKKKNKKN